ncbi:epoxide hydrolase family protein [Mycobacteroides chelonae]|uniref:epoxide hydrolase family protein n=1 Tax=Mycobacteroides chelonae TaxID=1774 RepID=UPI0007A0F264|nr:epoxide hydrolase family protein [Mycobacteroides chelonae]AMW20096.1 hydrolase [Mycobacterium sp. QIA-37]AYM42327.1 epoxide hydrolase [[Mycobacterium] chelonae subsp. gwanakae]OHU17351.1 hydrolase [Mycobacteroides chelonae]
MTSSDEIRTFRIDIPQEQLDDLHNRLSRTRLPFAIPGAGSEWDHGIAPDYLRELASYWVDGFDWRVQERKLNEFDHFLTEIDGQTIHFLHIRSPEPNAIPLLLNHSYPTSFVEFLEVSKLLTDPRSQGADPADAFHVVIPSLPGFAFSSPLSARGWNLERTALAFGELMARLGYARFGAEGGDLGAGVTGRLASLLPERVIGTHTHGDRLQLGMAGEDFPAPDGLSAEEHAELKTAQQRWAQMNGYRILHSTQPNPVSAGLADSPILQLAWIAEKFVQWANPATPISRENVLITASLYWFTRTGPAAADFYWELAHAEDAGWGGSSTAPHGSSLFYSDPLIRKVLGPGDRDDFFREHVEGGHFPAFEVPELLVDDIRAFFRSLRN